MRTDMTFVAFWIGLGLFACGIMLAAHLSRRELDKTIRQAIEKGVLVDAEMIARLKAPAGPTWGQRLVVLGIITLFAGAGAGVFAGLIGTFEPESVMPLLAIAAFVLFLGAGVLVSGIWLKIGRAHV